MTPTSSAWADALIHLLALASRLEGEGQYNLAKLTRAGADSMSRQAAYQVAVPVDKEALAADLKQTAEALSRFGVSAALLSAFVQGADVMAGGGVPLITIAPHPHVCRTCGHLLLGQPESNCPTCGAWPDTYQRFLPIYWLDVLEPPAALAMLRQTPGEVAKLLDGLSQAQLNQAPADGGWAIRNVLTHLRDAQDVLAFRLDLFLREEHPVLESKAVWTWAAKEQERPPTALEDLRRVQGLAHRYAEEAGAGPARQLVAHGPARGIRHRDAAPAGQLFRRP